MSETLIFGIVTSIVFIISIFIIAMVLKVLKSIKQNNEEIKEMEIKMAATKTATELALVDARKAVRVNILLNDGYKIKLDTNGKVYLLLRTSKYDKGRIFASIDEAWGNYAAEHLINPQAQQQMQQQTQMVNPYQTQMAGPGYGGPQQPNWGPQSNPNPFPTPGGTSGFEPNRGF